MMQTSVRPYVRAPLSRIVRCSALVVVVAAALGATRAADEWQLTLRVTETTTTEPPDPSPNAAKPSTRAAAAEPRIPVTETSQFEQLVSFGEGYLVVADEKETHLYDFTARRYREVSIAGDTATDFSLYALCAFRVQELQNRFYLGGALRAAGLAGADAPYAPFDVECLFGLQLPGKGTLANSAEGEPFTREAAEDGTVRFTREGREVTSFLASGTEVPAAQRNAWERFLAYTCAIHPRIRLQIVATGRLPARLEFVAQEFKRSQVTIIELLAESMVEGRSPAERLAESNGRPAVESPALAAVLANLPEATAPTRAAAAAFAEEAIGARRPLDGLLALIEYGLQTGEQPLAEMRQHMTLFKSDKQCQRFLGGSDQSSKEACERSLASYDSIKRKGLKKTYVLDILRGNLLTQLGKVREGEGLLIAALEANPFIGGVYNDLGGIYYGAYEMPQAWACWDAGRRLYPDHPLLKGVTDLEHRFEREFPWFF